MDQPQQVYHDVTPGPPVIVYYSYELSASSNAATVNDPHTSGNGGGDEDEDEDENDPASPLRGAAKRVVLAGGRWIRCT